MLYRVCRSFTADRPLQSGEIVDLAEGRNIQLLVEQRYLAPYTPELEAGLQTVSATKAAPVPPPVMESPRTRIKTAPKAQG